MNEVTDSDLEPGTLIKATYDCASFGSRYNRRVLEVRAGIVMRHPERREQTDFTYVVDFREFSEGSDGWSPHTPALVSRATALQTTDRYVLLEHFTSTTYYKHRKYTRQSMQLYKDRFGTIYDIAQRLHLPAIYAVLRLAK